MGTPHTEPKKKTVVDQFVTWLNGHELEEEAYVTALQDIISECNARLEEEKSDETSRD